jgi:hypothetical protein
LIERGCLMGEFIRDRRPDPLAYFESEGLTLTGPGKWRTTRCDFHGGSDSMRINTATGAWVCMACGVKGGDVLSHHMARHGLEFVEAARQLGAYEDDHKPHRGSAKPMTLSARAGLEVLSFESTITAVAASNVANGVVLTDADRARLLLAAGRIQRIADEVAR